MRFKILITLCLFFTAFSVYDIAPNPISANGIYTVENCEIRMESEIVKVDLFPEKSIVNCVFEMKNYGPTTSLEVGFPVMDFDYWNFGGYSEMDKANFKIKVDSKFLSKEDIKVPKELDSVYQQFMTVLGLEKEHKRKIDSTYQSHNVKHRKNGSLIFPKDLKKREMQKAIDSIHNFYWDNGLTTDLISKFHDLTKNGKFPWYVWDVNFKENETKTIIVKYELPSGLFGKNKFRYFKYILNTGAGWYKDIGKVEIILHLIDFSLNDVEDISPKGYTINKSKKTINWTFKNLEPTEKDDIYVQYATPKDKRIYNKVTQKRKRQLRRVDKSNGK